MVTDEQLIRATDNFLSASEDFGFVWESPYFLTDELRAFGYIGNYGSKNGVVICLTSPPDFLTDNRIADWCAQHDCFCSFLNIESCSGEYNRSYFRNMLRDWGKY